MNEDTLKAWFTQFNRDYFNDELPEPRLLLSHSRTHLGSMSYKRRISWRGMKPCDYTIRISTFYNCGEREWQNILLHEMIHLYIASKRMKDTSSHGKLFRQYMEHLNNNHGWNIRISTATRKWQTTKTPEKKIRTVLALRLKNGNCFLSVINPQYIHLLQRKLQTVPDIEYYRWMETDDNFFCDFPVVRSLRGRKISKQKFDELMHKTT